MDKLLTIIVPSYNTEQYIRECSQSYLTSTYLDEIEIIFINDGSSDSTGELIEELVKAYPNSVKLINKENGGHGSTINIGVQIATGKYFKIVDGDDWVDSAGLDKLMDDIRDKNIDIIINPYKRIYEKAKKEILVKFDVAEGVSKLNDLAPKLQELSIHAITYRTELLQNHQFQVREKCYYDDAEYVLYPLKYMETALVLDYPVYNYRVGTTEQSINPQKVYKNRDMHKQIVLDCINFWNEEREFIIGNKNDYCKKFVIKKILTQYSIYLKAPFSREHLIEFREWDAQLREKDEELYRLCDKSVVWVVRRGGIVAYSLVWLFFQVYQRSVHRGWN